MKAESKLWKNTLKKRPSKNSRLKLEMACKNVKYEKKCFYSTFVIEKMFIYSINISKSVSATEKKAVVQLGWCSCNKGVKY